MRVQCMIVHRDPRDGRYQSITAYGSEERISLAPCYVLLFFTTGRAPVTTNPLILARSTSIVT
jgi:hypothetical protein